MSRPVQARDGGSIQTAIEVDSDDDGDVVFVSEFRPSPTKAAVLSTSSSTSKLTDTGDRWTISVESVFTSPQKQVDGNGVTSSEPTVYAPAVEIEETSQADPTSTHVLSARPPFTVSQLPAVADLDTSSKPPRPLLVTPHAIHTSALDIKTSPPLDEKPEMKPSVEPSNEDIPAGDTPLLPLPTRSITPEIHVDSDSLQQAAYSSVDNENACVHHSSGIPQDAQDIVPLPTAEVLSTHDLTALFHSSGTPDVSKSTQGYLERPYSVSPPREITVDHSATPRQPSSKRVAWSTEARSVLPPDPATTSALDTFADLPDSLTRFVTSLDSTPRRSPRPPQPASLTIENRTRMPLAGPSTFPPSPASLPRELSQTRQDLSHVNLATPVLPEASGSRGPRKRAASSEAAQCQNEKVGKTYEYPTPLPSAEPSSPRRSHQPKRFTIGPRPYRIDDFEGRGRGLRATANLIPGDLIEAERPFIKFTFPIEAKEMRAAYNRLDDRDQALFDSFHGMKPRSGTDHDLVDIAEVNSLAMPVPETEDDDETPVQGGIFKNISRMNHSCLPNAGWVWDPAKGVQYLTAFMDIAAGQEITACYTPHALLFAERSKRLLQDWGIKHCGCAACSGTAGQIAESDARIQRYHDLRDTWPTESDADCRPFVNDRALALASLAEAEDLMVDEKQVLAFAEIYELVATVHAAWGEDEETSRAAKKATWYFRLTNGRRAARDSDVRRWWKDPTSNSYWAVMLEKPRNGVVAKKRKKRTVGYPTPKFGIR